MTQEEKELLLKDLCERLPYGVMVSVKGDEFDSYKYPYILTAVSKFGLDCLCKVYHPIYTPFGVVPTVEDIKPYLRPMSSMTDEEFLTLYDMCRDKVFQFREHPTYYTDFKTEKYVPTFIYNSNQLDYLISHHFDYHGLIPMELALEAPEDMYNV